MANEQKPATPKPATETVIPVINNVEALQQIALAGRKGFGSVIPGETLQLKPGLNFVPAKMWAEASENEQAKRLLETPIPASKAPQFNPECVGKMYLQVLAPLPKGNELSGLTEKEALALIEEMNDPRELTRLEKVDGRDGVRAALRQRHAIITRTPGKAA